MVSSGPSISAGGGENPLPSRIAGAGFGVGGAGGGGGGGGGGGADCGGGMGSAGFSGGGVSGGGGGGAGGGTAGTSLGGGGDRGGGSGCGGSGCGGSGFGGSGFGGSALGSGFGVFGASGAGGGAVPGWSPPLPITSSTRAPTSGDSTSTTLRCSRDSTISPTIAPCSSADARPAGQIRPGPLLGRPRRGAGITEPAHRDAWPCLRARRGW